MEPWCVGGGHRVFRNPHYRGFRKTFRKSSENFFRNPLFAYLGDEESFYVAFSPLINAKTLQN